MGILNIISKNLQNKARTRKPAEIVEYPLGFRGMLQHEADLCTACQTCAYVCSPGAIKFTDFEQTYITWEYFAEQCTYCGRCVEYCPTHALSFASVAPTVTTNVSDLALKDKIYYQSCTRCGKLIIVIPEPILREKYGEPLPVDIAEREKLCEKCRKKVASEKIKQALTRS